MKIHQRQFSLIAFVVILSALFVLNIMRVEYFDWTSKLACMQKCEKLGFKQCTFEPEKKTKPQRCQCGEGNRKLYLVLN